MSLSNPSWEEFRRNMPVAQQWAYFDHAAVAPLSGPARAAIDDWTTDVALDGGVNWNRWRQEVEEARKLGAEMIGASPSEIAVVHNTTEGINLVAEGYPWKAGDNVVVPECEFPSNLYPWMNLRSRGVDVRQVPVEDERLDLNRLDEMCDGRTRIVAVSWVGYAGGWRNDVAALAEIAHQNDALLCLDAIQGLGVLPLNVSETPVDFLAADGHKWLLSPEGAGLFYIRKEHLDLLRPIGVGWNSVKHAGDFANTLFELKQSTDRYEGGSYNMAGIAGLAAGLRFLMQFGIEQMAERLLEITDELCERLLQLGAEISSCREGNRRSGIVSFQLPEQDPQQVRLRCKQAGVIVNCRSGRLRVSPHVYCNDEDIDRLIAALVLG
ncbi:MAG: aminotransferase class V-fold PLP-dependent enzyme [Planctomycetes bacterium]|nr:aminotransferase class V-fold PLP-dependent enzyme [Planctomycetota bacterium]